jgi:FdhD protein
MTGKTVSAGACVPTEAPVDLIYNGHLAGTLMCTPQELSALALGWLFGQGLIKEAREVYTIGACEDLHKVYVQTAVDRWDERRGWEKVVTSGCGGGTVLAAQLSGRLPKVGPGPAITLSDLRRSFKEMGARSTLYQKSGGLHSAALAAEGKLLAHSEDIGRHNAVDKVIGKGLLLELDFSRTVLLTTGRISCEMVIKAAQAGVPAVASLTTATDLALELARGLQITVIGRAAGCRLTVYTGAERVIGWAGRQSAQEGSEAGPKKQVL